MLLAMRRQYVFLAATVTAVAVLFALTVVALSVVAVAQSLSTATPPAKPSLTATAPVKPTLTPPVTAAAAATATPTFILITPRPSLTPPATATLTATPETPGPTPDGAWRHVRVPILMYHYVSAPPEGADNYRVGLSVTPEQFRAQMQYIQANGYHPVTLDQVLFALLQGKALPPRPVALTFDDGYADMYTNAFPILQEFGFVGTFFVVTGWIDEQNPAYLTWEQARAMAQAGMRIESHSKSHPDLSGKPRDYIVYEVLGSIESIEAHTGYRPRFFCYPAGKYDDNLVAMLPEFGIWGAVTTEPGTRHYSDKPYTLRRVRVSNDTSLAQFAAFLEWGKEGDE